MSPNVKVSLGALVIACATGYLAFLGASTSWQYYVHVDECVRDQAQFRGHRMRVSGRVASGSLKIYDDRRSTSFVLCGERASLDITCKSPVPDNLAEDMDVVVEGTLESSGHFRGDKLMTRCASKYQAQPNSPQE